MKKILITGGTGFIGSHVSAECERRGIEYLALSSRPRPDNPNICPVSLQDVDTLKSVLSQFQPDAIIHLAAIASPTHDDIAEVYGINVGGTENLLNAASQVLKNHPRIVLTSTAGVYGNQDVPLLREDLPFNPANHYSYSKMITEFLSKQYEKTLDIRIVRPFNVVGKGQKPIFFIPKTVNAFLTRQPDLKIGNLDAVRDYVDVDFCANVMLDLAIKDDLPCHITNICSGNGYSCRQVIEILEQMTDHHPRILSTSTFIRTNEVWRMVGDPTNLNKIVDGRFISRTLHEILADMMQM